jgi:hypothetical protein
VHSRHDFNVAVWTDTRDGTQDVYSARFVTPFQPPRLYAPVDGFVTMDSAVAFRWSTCWHESEDSYRLELSFDSTFATGVVSHVGLTDNAFSPGTYFATGHYYWRVKAFRAAGDSTEYSPVWDFAAACQTALPPTPVSPAAGDTLADSSVTLTWSQVPEAVAYHVQLSGQPGFVPLLADTTLAGTSVSLSGLGEDSAHYYWRVQATNNCGTGAWSASDFRIIFCPIQLTGDVNESGTITSADIVRLVNYVFKSGAPPEPLPQAGDVDCNNQVSSADIIKLVNFTFKSGPPPCDACSLL